MEHKNVLRNEDRALQQCLACGVSFVFPQPKADVIVAHFRESSELTDGELGRKFEKNRERVLGRVARYIQSKRQSGSILDVGCATGFFLARFFRPAQWQISAVELSSRKADCAAQNGIRVFVGDVHAAHFESDSFDVLTVLDAFYYFPNPLAELSEFLRILKPDGLLFLELPWATSRRWRRSLAGSRLLGENNPSLLESSDHLFYYTPRSISLLLERCGFQVQTLIPLPGNRQERRLRDLLWRTYSLISRALYVFSASRIFLGPRFLAVAVKPGPCSPA